MVGGSSRVATFRLERVEAELRQDVDLVERNLALQPPDAGQRLDRAQVASMSPVKPLLLVLGLRQRPGADARSQVLGIAEYGPCVRRSDRQRPHGGGRVRAAQVVDEALEVVEDVPLDVPLLAALAPVVGQDVQDRLVDQPPPGGQDRRPGSLRRLVGLAGVPAA